MIARWAWGRMLEAGAVWRRGLGVATLLAMVGGWSATAYAVWWCTLVRYPMITERDWQFEIARSMQCALDQRKDETLIISPQFQVASVFAEFVFAQPDRAAGQRIWRLGTRTVVSPGELYVFPRRGEPPKGKEVCTIKNQVTGQIVSQVYAAPDPEPERSRARSPGSH
ncbi:MAG: hypothetical protein H6730_16065 [Deltaproteobacteria bacterium]|nr:hypothetical protein [Deltaproteobacteria bacterium]